MSKKLDAVEIKGGDKQIRITPYTYNENGHAIERVDVTVFKYVDGKWVPTKDSVSINRDGAFWIASIFLDDI